MLFEEKDGKVHNEDTLTKKEGIHMKFLSYLLQGLIKSQEKTAKKILKTNLYY
ncbi:hypothetical protein JCM9140_3491 [Halalkalibacter wakoensis JCM 9140]|uniref:Uncharacterized protein n=1 Tax=Halalkalibacter wakoensis JCM 9140 TaxID=1236970 RepID=W4Q5T5_9BACI|nr:hypothetical protein JCM9140_3491 [Halalkalibacter wakoensis JCM 9140]